MELVAIDAHRVREHDDAELCRLLEEGNILFLRETPFLPPEEDCEFLRSRRQTEAATHKNIAYKPHLDRTTGLGACTPEEADRLHRIMAEYSRRALDFLAALLPRYARSWRVDYASFRPLEEAGRKLPIRHRNDLMHVDSFPTRPTHGGRILRAFSNLHPARSRVWVTSDPFAELARRYALEAGLLRVLGPAARARRSVRRLARRLGLRGPAPSAYDEFMLRFHHFLKENEAFQKEGERHRFEFPPGSTWISFTDQIAHKVTEGQFALEQTCIVPVEAMLQPALSPLAILEALAGRRLVPESARGGKNTSGRTSRGEVA